MTALWVRIAKKEKSMAASTRRLGRAIRESTVAISAFLTMFCGLFFAVDSAQAENSVEELLEKLRSADVFESQQAEAELLRLGPEALAPLSRAIETSDRVSRFRANQLFSDLVGTLLVQYEREQHAYDRDQSALRKLADAKREEGARV